METQENTDTQNLPDYELAKLELIEKLKTLGFSLTCETISKRPDRYSDWDKLAGHVRFTIVHAQTRREHTGYYSAGSGIVADWAVRNALWAFRGTSLGSLSIKRTAEELKSFPRRLSVDGAADYEIMCRRWKPELVDVFSSLLSDVSSFEPGMTLHEWIDQDSGITEGMHAADVVDAYDAIVKTDNFLRRTTGTEYEKLKELACRL